MKIIEKIKKLREKTLPKDKRSEVKKDLIVYYIIRPIADILTFPCLKIKISATTVTKISLIFVIMMFILFLGGSVPFYIAGLISLFIWNVLDALDGNIARYTDTTSVLGGLWDATVGWYAVFFFFMSMGIVAFKEESLIPINLFPNYYYIILGVFAGMAFIMTRLVMHKKAGMLSKEEVAAVKDRANYGILKTIVFNISSVNGFGFVIFAISIFLRVTNICTIFYFILNDIIALGVLYSLLKSEKNNNQV